MEYKVFPLTDFASPTQKEGFSLRLSEVLGFNPTMGLPGFAKLFLVDAYLVDEIGLAEDSKLLALFLLTCLKKAVEGKEVPARLSGVAVEKFYSGTSVSFLVDQEGNPNYEGAAEFMKPITESFLGKLMGFVDGLKNKKR